MKITEVEISEYKENRENFNKYSKNALLDILLLKHNHSMSIKEIKNSTPYDINFIVHVIKHYQIHTQIDNEDSYDVSVNINKYNVNVYNLKEIYGDNLVHDMLDPSEKGVTYYFPI
jgi:hypothetical protein